MGCSGSKRNDVIHIKQADNDEFRQSQGELRLGRQLRRTSNQLTEDECAKVNSFIASTYDQSARVACEPVTNPPGSPSASKKSLVDQPPASSFNSRDSACMTYFELRQLLAEMDDELFKYFCRIFDPHAIGYVNVEQFVKGLGLIIRAEANVDKQIAACFYMFDTFKNDRLSKNDFKAMIEATIGLKLRYLLNTDQGKQVFVKQLRQEHSEENLDFYQKALEYEQLTDTERLAFALHLYEEYVKDGADQQVNLPAKYVKEVEKGLSPADSGCVVPRADLFAKCKQEIYSLLEKDSFCRCKQNPRFIDKVVDDFFDKVDPKCTGYIGYDQYSEWVHQNPEVIAFFADISKIVRGVLDKLAGNVAVEPAM